MNATPTTFRYCPKCNSTTSTATYCHRDGSKLLDFVVCECGLECGPYDKFCEKCGKEVKR